MRRFKMEQIKINQFAILSKETTGDLKLGISLGMGVDKQQRSVDVQLETRYAEANELKVLLQITCSFSVHPDDWSAMQKGDKVVLPKQFLAHLVMHTFGTARGVLYCKTEDTPYQRFILPPTNVEQLVEHDLEV